MTSSSDLAAKANDAFIDEEFKLAVDYYSQAIALDPNSSHLFSDRAQANIKLNNFNEALADASKAIELDSSNAKAYLRKGTACFSLEEYDTAKTAFEAGCKLAPDDARFTDWIKKCEKCIAEEDGELLTESLDVAPTNVVASSQATEKTDATSEVIAPTPAKPKYRHEFYQKPEEVVVTIFAKGIPANSVFVNYGEQILSVTIDVPGNQRPTYPSLRPTKDWDKLEAQVKKEEKDEKLDGDSALNKFPPNIYKDTDDDTRRAMRQSIVESYGTKLEKKWDRRWWKEPMQMVWN
ncbi:protein SGT1 homolog B-like protein [Tanacetum coccineum]